jgi:hypothetical protein
MHYSVSDIQACDPEMLGDGQDPFDDVRVVITTRQDNTSAGCARVTIIAPTPTRLLSFFKENWGDAAETDPEWYFDHIIRRMEKVSDPAPEIMHRGGGNEDDYAAAEALFGPGIYCVTETPEDPSIQPLWVGRAANPVDALNIYSRLQGFAGYDQSEMRNEVGIYAWNDLGDDGGAWATFTNTTIYATPVDFVAEQPDEVPADRTVLVRVYLTVSSGADPWPDADIVQLVEGALSVGLEGAPHPKADAITNIAVVGEEVVA